MTQLRQNARTRANVSFVEPLASRINLAATVPLAPEVAQMDNHHRLIVITTDGADRFSITESAGRIYVKDLAADAMTSFANKRVRKIVVHLKQGDDSLTLDTKTPVLARGDYGNDTIVGGAEHDDLFGDHGDDLLYGNGGNDMLSGGEGRDFLNGGAGADTLHGDAGRDHINSFDVGALASDVVDGGSGADFYKCNSNDYVKVQRRDRPMNLD